MVCANMNCRCRSEPKIINEMELEDVSQGPLPRRFALMATADGGSLYLYGGCHFVRYSNFGPECIWRYDLLTLAWTRAPVDLKTGHSLEAVVFATKYYQASSAIICHQEDLPAGIFLVTKFDYEKEEANRLSFCFLSKADQPQQPASTGLGGKKTQKKEQFALDELPFVDHNALLADFPLEPDNTEVLADGPTKFYFVTTTTPYSIYERCDITGTLLFIFELGKLTSQLPQAAGQESANDNWNWRCLTNYSIVEKKVVSDGHLVDNDATFASMDKLLDTYTRCFLFNGAIWIFIMEENAAAIDSSNGERPRLYRQVIRFDLAERKFSSIQLCPADPSKGIPSRRWRDRSLVHGNSYYLLPGVDSHAEKFTTMIWRLDLVKLEWTAICEWEMVTPCVDYAAVSCPEQNCIFIFGGVSVFSAAASGTLIHGEDSFHPPQGLVFLNGIQQLNIPPE